MHPQHPGGWPMCAAVLGWWVERVANINSWVWWSKMQKHMGRSGCTLLRQRSSLQPTAPTSFGYMVCSAHWRMGNERNRKWWTNLAMASGLTALSERLTMKDGCHILWGVISYPPIPHSFSHPSIHPSSHPPIHPLLKHLLCASPWLDIKGRFRVITLLRLCMPTVSILKYLRARWWGVWNSGLRKPWIDLERILSWYVE